MFGGTIIEPLRITQSESSEGKQRGSSEKYQDTVSPVKDGYGWVSDHWHENWELCESDYQRNNGCSNSLLTGASHVSLF